jgi:hypothetical protein
MKKKKRSGLKMGLGKYQDPFLFPMLSAILGDQILEQTGLAVSLPTDLT